MAERIEQGVAIRTARIANRMTQAHLAAAAGVSEKTARRAEAGDRIGPESMRALCSVLDLDATTLSTEAECVPAAAAEADRRIAEIKRRSAFRLSVLTMSLVATSAWAVFEAREAAAIGVFVLLCTVANVVGNLASVATLAAYRRSLVAGLRDHARELGDSVRSPAAAIRDRLVAPGEAMTILCLAAPPPLVLSTEVALKTLIVTGSDRSSYDAFGLLLATWLVLKVCVRGPGGQDEEVLLAKATATVTAGGPGPGSHPAT